MRWIKGGRHLPLGVETAAVLMEFSSFSARYRQKTSVHSPFIFCYRNYAILKAENTAQVLLGTRVRTGAAGFFQGGLDDFEEPGSRLFAL